MGFLKNLISETVSEGVGKGIRDGVGKGIKDAVGKAVESAVQPAADKLAGQAAESLNEAARNLNDGTEVMRAAQAETKNAVSGAAAGETAAVTGSGAGTATGTGTAIPGSGVASLEAALTGWAGAMQSAAGQAARNMKECPKCGEIVTADHKFCPKCGAQLPEKTLAEGFLCPNCGKQNAPGTTYCMECGMLLPAAEEANAAQLAKWGELLPRYPKWTLGGSLELEEDGEINGYPAVRLSVDGAGAAELAQYVEMLKADGFVPAYDGDSDVYYKVADGVCRAFDKTDYNSGGGMTVTFFVGDYDKRAAAKEKAEAEARAAKDNARAKAEAAKDTAKAATQAAKGLFKKFF